MSTIEINKIVGAVLMALLIMLGLSFIVELVTAQHVAETEPVFVVETQDTAPVTAEAEADEGVSLVALLTAADPARGEKDFKQCAACHSPDAGTGHKIGPNLWGVVGALKARHEDFGYSGALADLGGWWTFGALDSFLADPKGYAPGNKMAFRGITSPEKRASMLAYLRSLSDEPVPLPTSEIEAQEGATQSTITKMAREGRAAAEAAAETTVEMAEDAAAAASEMADEAMQSAEEMADAAAETAQEMTEAASEMAADATEAAGEMAEDAQEMVADATAAVGAAVSDLVDRIANADLSAGEKAYRKCQACHTPDQGGKHRIGPNLWGVVGAPKARHDDFKYSASLTEMDGDWSFEALDAFLAKPADYAKGTKMAFAGIRDEGERAEVIAYLRSLSDSPAPLE